MLQYIDRADQEIKKAQEDAEAIKEKKLAPEEIDQIAEVIKKKTIDESKQNEDLDPVSKEIES